MLENKKNQKKTVFGGIGVALLLCALMVLMPMSGYVDNNEATVESVEADTAGEEEYFQLPEKIAEENYEYDPSLELQGCLLYTSPSPRDSGQSRMPSSA